MRLADEILLRRGPVSGLTLNSISLTRTTRLLAIRHRVGGVSSGFAMASTEMLGPAAVTRAASIAGNVMVPLLLKCGFRITRRPLIEQRQFLRRIVFFGDGAEMIGVRRSLLSDTERGHE